jgi:membrane protein implicated in regulation of membrane protease activity
MIEWFTELTTLQQVFAGMAVVASALFVIQLIMMMIGGHHGDADAHVDGDFHVDVSDADVGHIDADVSAHVDVDGPGTDVDAVHADSDVAFQVISVQGTVAFFMLLGWVGLAANRAAELGPALSIGVGVAAGLAANLLFAKMFQAFKRMQSSGTMNLKNAIGQEGEIYLNVNPNTPGKVRVAVQQHLKVFDAMSDDGSAIPTGTRVVVVRVVKGNTMVVKRI